MAPADADAAVNAFRAVQEIRFVVPAGAGDGAAGNRIASQDLDGFDCRGPAESAAPGTHRATTTEATLPNRNLNQAMAMATDTRRAAPPFRRSHSVFAIQDESA
ncbi:MAG: hypothetical protein JNK59_09725 [Sterolibacteriaceae bacterium]|nr:hypothetical protein [Sterolibacteriaceae bacterium]